MVVNRDREDLLGVFLTDDKVVEMLEEFGRRGDSVFKETGDFIGRFRLSGEFFSQNGGADINALVADVDAGAGDEFLDL